MFFGSFSMVEFMLGKWVLFIFSLTSNISSSPTTIKSSITIVYIINKDSTSRMYEILQFYPKKWSLLFLRTFSLRYSICFMQSTNKCV